MGTSRREFLVTASAAAALAAAPRAFGDWEPSPRYPDPAVRVLDPSFARYRLALAKVERLGTGFRWCEGPAWFGDGRYLLWSDIPNDRMMKWEEETGAISVFRKPSHNSNGNTRDRQGRLVTCEHDTRRVTRTEHDGTITVIADRFDGKPLNSPNDVVCRSDGSIWFSDPPYGILGYYEGHRATPELPTNVYRVDPATGAVAVVAGDLERPNGLAFSPDESLLYVVEGGPPKRLIRAYDVVDGGTRAREQANARRRRRRHARRPARRRRRQPVGGLGHGRGGQGRRFGVRSLRQADRPHRPARALREPLLRRPLPQPPVHVRLDVSLLALRRHPGGGRRLSPAQPEPKE